MKNKTPKNLKIGKDEPETKEYLQILQKIKEKTNQTTIMNCFNN
ncbi:hypothetical protein [Methanonatronarchaeum sp. AMET-Sl]|nr:hypothetical protein [Methanonatronarchaeum sp. AMET-Sl]WGI17127.1 hypothetical protein QEN48_06400 [Methanonatronarchaeum sp. AMET-Sl]WGI17865.1 hypothetical protein QEN48_02345 [Methanonatronarchaeum sp. AMET-Sl]